MAKIGRSEELLKEIDRIDDAFYKIHRIRNLTELYLESIAIDESISECKEFVRTHELKRFLDSIKMFFSSSKSVLEDLCKASDVRNKEWKDINKTNQENERTSERN